MPASQAEADGISDLVEAVWQSLDHCSQLHVFKISSSPFVVAQPSAFALLTFVHTLPVGAERPGVT